ncbi:hypothetical protein NW768_009702 [Fusarium equiseti]|uniref:WSC domain-containing protein n=1 Tax=Fusarium equiseti TaxID=61235 RepID=A0ABQ8R1N3_FUSEQ|nr:hypothetical protein NW768_009702 [Fusarium equiseti]
MKSPGAILVLWALLLPRCLGITVDTSDPEAALVTGPGVEVISSSFLGNQGSIGVFNEGPFGIGSGVIVSSGFVQDAVPGGFANSDVGTGGSAFCGGANFVDAAVWTVQVEVQNGYNGVLVEFIAATADENREADPIAIWLDGVQYALDSSGQQITASSSYFQQPIVIPQPDNDLQFNIAAPPLLLGIPAVAGPHTLVFAACDANDPYLDTGLLFKIQGCEECDEDIKINYATSTITVAAGAATSTTETIKASGTFSGTFLVTVQAAPYTSTTEADTTTTTAEQTTATTATAEPTTTADTTEVTSGSQTSTDTTSVDSSSTTENEADSTTTTDTTGTTVLTSEQSTVTSDTGIATTTYATSSADSETSTDTETIISTTSDIETGDTADSTTISSSTFDTTSNDVTGTSTITQSDETVATNGPTSVVSTNTDTESVSDSQSTRSSTNIEPSFTSGTTVVTDAEESTRQVDKSAMTASSDVEQPSATPSGAAFNLPFIGEYAYFGCLGSMAGYPTFKEVLTDDEDMTTEKCVSLAAGSKYIGVYQRSCYAANSLSGSMRVPDASCDLLCPGDTELFCGGTTSVTRRRRDISSNILLTLYAREDASSSLTAGVPTSASADDLSTGVAAGESGTSLVAEPISSTEDVLQPTASETETTKARLPVGYPTAGPGYMPTMRWTKGYNITKTMAAPATTVTTVIYTTVDRDHPDQLVTTEVAVTIGYTPCNCADQILPPIAMTTVMAPCNSCGPRGESNVWLTVPAAACESDRPNRRPDMKVDSHDVGPQYKAPVNPAPKLQPSAKSDSNPKSPESYQDTDNHWPHQQDSEHYTNPYRDQFQPSEVDSHRPTMHPEIPFKPQDIPSGTDQVVPVEPPRPSSFTTTEKDRNTKVSGPYTASATEMDFESPNMPVVVSEGIKSVLDISCLLVILSGTVLHLIC